MPDRGPIPVSWSVEGLADRRGPVIVDDLAWIARMSAVVPGFIARRLQGSRADFPANLRSVFGKPFLNGLRCPNSGSSHSAKVRDPADCQSTPVTHRRLNRRVLGHHPF